MKNKIFSCLICLMLLTTLAFADSTNFDSVTVAPPSSDTYGLRVNNTSGTRVFSVDSSGNAYVAGTLDVTGVVTAPSAVLATPKATFGYTSMAVPASATYTVTTSDPSPGTYRITGGCGTTTLVMTYTGTAASNAGKIFYIINSSSNSVTFKQSGGTGVTVAAGKIVTVIGNGTDFERVTADQ